MKRNTKRRRNVSLSKNYRKPHNVKSILKQAHEAVQEQAILEAKQEAKKHQEQETQRRVASRQTGAITAIEENADGVVPAENRTDGTGSTGSTETAEFLPADAERVLELEREAIDAIQTPAVALQTTSVITATDDMPTVAISLGAGDNLCEITESARREAMHRRRRESLLSRLTKPLRQAILGAFNVWLNVSRRIAQALGWFPCVLPYVGYGTEEYSRLVCRTVYAPANTKPGEPERGIHAMLAVPAAGQRVWMSIDNVPVRTVQVGTMEVYDRKDPARSTTADYAVSDSSGYLDLLAEHQLAPGIHTVTCRVKRRRAIKADLFTIPDSARVGIISDVDDTIMVTQVPTFWKAAYNMLFLSPHKRASVPGMAVLYNKIHDMFPEAPFFYLSTSPWNVESGIRNFMANFGFPGGPLLLRDMDPRPNSFVPSGVTHKLEFAEQLMEDFPDMKFILLGDDGQKDPTTYATIARRYPGRVLAIGIRQLSPREASGGLNPMSSFATTQPMPETDVPVFTGTTGANLMKTMLPYLEQYAK